MLFFTYPVREYGDTIQAYAENTNQLVRGMSVGLTAYLAVLGLVIGWYFTRKKND